jgi:hypothetical protein
MGKWEIKKVTTTAIERAETIVALKRLAEAADADR